VYHKKHFEIQEAQNLLINILPDIIEMINLKRVLDEKGVDIYKHHYFGGIGSNGSGKYPVELERLIEFIDDFSSKGILIKSIDEGLIDFPHIRSDGEEVYLCWKYGEEKILFWHSIRDGFSGRKSLENL
jgi:hypothetical protein